MTNHFHLVLQDPAGTLSSGMQALNPVRARITFRPEQWPWSSCRAHLGLDHPAPFLALAAFQRLLAPTPAGAWLVYPRLLRETLAPPPNTGERGRT